MSVSPEGFGDSSSEKMIRELTVNARGVADQRLRGKNGSSGLRINFCKLEDLVLLERINSKELTQIFDSYSRLGNS